MMISIGHKSFLESTCIDEILAAHEPRAAELKRLAAEVGMLINATEGKRAKSMIKLKTEHIVLSALAPETLRSKLRRVKSLPAPADDFEATQTAVKNLQEGHSEFPSSSPRKWGLDHAAFPRTLDDEPDNRRCGLDRRRFSYTWHIPERRRGEDRRKLLAIDSSLSG